MPQMNVSVLEQNVIECIRDAIADADKNATRHGTLDGREITIRAVKQKNTSNIFWVVSVLIKNGNDL